LQDYLNKADIIVMEVSLLHIYISV